MDGEDAALVTAHCRPARTIEDNGRGSPVEPPDPRSTPFAPTGCVDRPRQEAATIARELDPFDPARKTAEDARLARTIRGPELNRVLRRGHNRAGVWAELGIGNPRLVPEHDRSTTPIGPPK